MRWLCGSKWCGFARAGGVGCSSAGSAAASSVRKGQASSPGALASRWAPRAGVASSPRSNPSAAARTSPHACVNARLSQRAEPWCCQRCAGPASEAELAQGGAGAGAGSRGASRASVCSASLLACAFTKLLGASGSASAATQPLTFV